MLQIQIQVGTYSYSAWSALMSRLLCTHYSTTYFKMRVYKKQKHPIVNPILNNTYVIIERIFTRH